MTRAVRLVGRNALAYRHKWSATIFLNFLQPALYLAAMGLGLGRLVDAGGAQLPGGVSYLTFFGPGLLAATCMQTACFESSWPITDKMTWHRNYEAITATPLSVVDIVVGEVMWNGVRLFFVATSFAAVLCLFGAVRPLAAIEAVPAAVLTGLAFSAPVMAFAGYLKAGENFNVMFRFIITPLFLFSGVFFPVTRLPGVLQIAAAFTPLFHGVELTRGLALGTVSWQAAALHVAFLVVMLVIGMRAAVLTFSKKLRA